MSASVHFLATVIWGLYSIVIGALVVVYGYSSDFAWISIWIAVVGNASHLVTFAWSQKGVNISAEPASGKQVVNSAGQVIGTVK